jgi:tRNA-2-methylthio-N6-dimethylallyladenosine synthase
MQGCNNFCSYCIVPYVRGRELSRDPDAVMAELDLLSGRRVREITLLGQNVNSYSYGTLDFPGLLRRVTAHLRESASPIQWVRFLTSHPKDFSPALLDVMAGEPLLCRHIHLPVQSGSTAILAAMNRRYTREDYLEKAGRIREKLSDSTLSTDILVGFPGETDRDFEDTLDLLRMARFSEAFMYYYNPREGTPAVTLEGQLPLKITKERLQGVIDTQLAILRDEMAKRVGETCTVLAEGVSRDCKTELKARTAQNHQVVFPGDAELIGNFVKVSLDSLTGNTFRATMTT